MLTIYSYVQVYVDMKYMSYLLSCNTAESKWVQRGPARVSCADRGLVCLNNIDCRTENTIIYRLHRQGRNRPACVVNVPQTQSSRRSALWPRHLCSYIWKSSGVPVPVPDCCCCVSGKICFLGSAYFRGINKLSASSFNLAVCMN